jgi:regulator of sirC expression with transglutaminase-like and TPR domain
MPDKSQLPYLVELLDDDSDEVRDEILKSLSNYGNQLEKDLFSFTQLFNSEKLSIVKPILDDNRRKWLYENWKNWQSLPTEYSQLEEAMDMICKFQYGFNYPEKITVLLDNLAEEFAKHNINGNEIDLADFLFKHKKLFGERDDYYNPLNSNLIYVLKKKRGLPISLTIIYILVAQRLGLTVEGCNFPGHFLAKVKVKRDIVLIDAYNNGRIINEDELKELSQDSVEAIIKIINLKTNSKIVVRRVLNNLINAYGQINDEKNKSFFIRLLNITPW